MDILKLKSNKYNSFILAILVLAIYFISLHPISGFIGGLLFLIIKWPAPIIFTFLISRGITERFSNSKHTEYIFAATFILFSILMPIIPNIKNIVKYFITPSDTGYEVTHKIDLKEGNSIRYFLEPYNFINVTYPNIITTNFSIGGDEGCMCMYLESNKENTYLRYLLKNINKNTHMEPNKLSNKPENNSTYYKFAITKSIEENATNKYMFEFNIIKDGLITAKFWQKGIPASVLLNKTFSRHDSLKKDFFKNATILFMVDSPISRFISEALNISYFPNKEIRKFLKESVNLVN